LTESGGLAPTLQKPIFGRHEVSRSAPFVLGEIMSSERPAKTRKPILTLHDWEAKHYVLAAVIILVVMGLFAYSWA
jgi:hypothetical protein